MEEHKVCYDNKQWNNRGATNLRTGIAEANECGLFWCCYCCYVFCDVADKTDIVLYKAVPLNF